MLELVGFRFLNFELHTGLYKACLVPKHFSHNWFLVTQLSRVTRRSSRSQPGWRAHQGAKNCVPGNTF